VSKPVSDLERYLGEDFPEKHDAWPPVIILLAILLVVLAVL
jgi:hypothetical protein